MLVFRNKAKVKIEYPLENLSQKSKILFFDIETTGFSRKYCSIYLIGCMYFVGDTPMYIQWLAENINDEANILMAFHKFIKDYDTLIHFNGNSFDIPFVKARGEKYRLDFDFERFNSIDIYKKISRLSHILNLENLKQKSFEKYLGLNRSDPFSGGDLIEVYKQYTLGKDEKLLIPLLLHNCEDVWYMGYLTSLLAIWDLFDEKYHVDSYSLNEYENIHNEKCIEIVINLILEESLPAPLSFSKNNIFLKAENKGAMISIKAQNTVLKLFYPDYKDYYYLPEEDKAMHKSVAMFVNSEFRKKATASTCYEKRKDTYVPVFCNHNDTFSYLFREDYKSKERYIRIEDINTKNIHEYTSCILSYLKKKEL